MSRDILFTLVQNLYHIGYIVVAIVYDIGPTNMRLWRDCNIAVNIEKNNHLQDKDITISSEQQCFIAHPTDHSLKIFFIYVCIY